MQLFLDEEITALPARAASSSRPTRCSTTSAATRGAIAAHHWGVPAIQLSPTYVAWEGYEYDMAEFTAALKASESGARFFAGVRAWLDENGMSIDADSFLGRPEKCVVLIPRVLQPNEERVGPQFVFTGPCLDESRITGVDAGRRRAAGVRRVRHRRTRTTWRSTGRAWRRLSDFRLVIATGKVDPAELGIGERTQPQLDVLAHADVFVTHAGMGSAAESLWFGVPTVAIPQAVDQFTNAAQLEAVGAGVHLPAEQVTVETLRDAVARALRVRAARTRAARRDPAHRRRFRERRRGRALRRGLTPSGSTSGGEVPIDWA